MKLLLALATLCTVAVSGNTFGFFPCVIQSEMFQTLIHSARVEVLHLSHVKQHQLRDGLRRLRRVPNMPGRQQLVHEVARGCVYGRIRPWTWPIGLAFNNAYFYFILSESGSNDAYVRSCIPKNSGIEVGCKSQDYNGATGTMCYCDTDDCNSAGKVGLSLFLMVFLAFFAMYFNWKKTK